MTIYEKPPIVHMKDVEYVYSNGTVALQAINLSISKGELLAIMGKNGAGKTTLIRSLNGLIRPTNGNVYIRGENTRQKSIAELSKSIGIVFQNPHHQLFSNTVEDEIKFSLKNSKFDREEIDGKILETIEKFRLEKFKNRSPLTLSGGETKKLAIASILCRDTDLLVFDEPTLGQDAKEIAFFLDLIKYELTKGKTIIIVTHNVEFAIENIPRTILMADGKIIADGPTKNVLIKPFLTERTSLILPQVCQLKLALKASGIQCPPEIQTKGEMIRFLTSYLNDRIS
ncbi:MAG: energy-coupling factor ABC transporter ATP-binding protein [Promethearchaeota archaeon]